MARVSRHELKQDQFVSTFEETLDFVAEHRETLAAGLLAVVLGVGALGGFWWYARRQEGRASFALGHALDIYAAPIRLNPGELPDSYRGPSFASEKEKYEAAQKEFTRLRREFAETSVAVVAKHYEALSLFQLGKRDEAVRILEEVSRAASRERAALAQFHLAGLYQQLGRTEDARKLYQKLADQPSGSVPRELALLALADLYATTQPAQARKLYEELKRLLPDTRLAGLIDRRLELLPRAP